MPSQTKRHESELSNVADQPGSIQSAIRALEAKQQLIEQLMEDCGRLRQEIAHLKLEKERLKITVSDLKSYIARKASGHGRADRFQ
jgi:prefoldin subunit 5